uniref:Uncharacterized protein n=1 Tax=viral metagenome TaxID=1070528 RepID=A0A6C0F1Z5_9ZZZZ
MVNNNDKDKNQKENKKSKLTKMDVNLNTKVINGNDNVEKDSNQESSIKKQKNIKVKDKENNITFIVVERNGDLKEHEIKENAICAEELCKKCKFKKIDGYIKRTEWEYLSKSLTSSASSSASDNKIIIELWAKNDGLANYENKYEFPPPVDNELFFGACALIARNNKNNYINLTKDMWNKIYEYLFGGFESLAVNEDSDEEEEDELDAIPSNKKTRDGYLKDGFVVDGGGVAGDSEGDVEEAQDDSDTETDEDSDSSSDDDDSENGDKQSFSGDEGDGVGLYSNKKNKNALHINKMNVKNVATLKNVTNIKTYGSKHIIKDDEDENAGWNTDESSELSEEEYSYS